MSAYDAAVAWLYGLEAAKGMDFKLERVELALAAVGNPQHRYKVAHIAGTNGKGSVAAMLHSMLCAAGRRTGLYTSPHLERFTERIRVGDREIATDEVAALVDEIRSSVSSRGIDLTFFEFATVMAFTTFARHDVDVAVVEVGLGGRLDATNVVDPACSAITTIGLDHQEFLGDTIAAIASEKAGVIKPHRPVVSGRLPSVAQEVVRRTAAEKDSPDIELGRDFEILGTDSLRYRSTSRQVDGLKLALAGDHQRDNAAIAIACLEHLASPADVSDDAIRSGLVHVDWPGRLQTIGDAPRILLDGAHNVDGVRALRGALEPLLQGRRARLLFSVMRDKDWHPMVEVLAAIAEDVTVCEALSPRAAAASDVSAAFARHCPAAAIRDPAAALAHVLDNARRDDLVLVSGSLFLIGAILPLLRNDPSAAMAPIGTP